MGFDKNIQLELITKSKTRTYRVSNAKLSWGKFYRNPDKNAEMSADDVNVATFKYNANGVAASCGRQNSSSDAEGSIDMYDGSVYVRNIGWNNPWQSGSANTVKSDRVSADYAIEIAPYPCTGTIGRVRVTISHID